MTSLLFGVFLFLFTLFVVSVPSTAWMAPIEQSIEVGDSIGQGFENVMSEVGEAWTYTLVLADTTPLPPSALHVATASSPCGS